MTINVNQCARCGGNHTALIFTKLSGAPVGDCEYWSMCPTLSQPILLCVIVKD